MAPYFARSIFLAGLIVASLSLTACSSTQEESSAPPSTVAAPSGGAAKEASKPFKVALVTDIGGLNDRGFNQLTDQGLQKAIKDRGIKGEVTESKSGDDYVPALTSYASRGYDLVIAVGFLMQDAVGKVSGEFPNVRFAIIDGAGTEHGKDLKHPNVTSIYFKEQDAGALVGALAALLEKRGATPKKSHIVGVVGGIKIPPVDRYIAGFQWGVKQEDPTVKILVGYTNDFSDPGRGRDVANSQIGAGADIVMQVAGGCGLGVLQAAEQKGVYSIGVDKDQKEDNRSVIASALKRVEVATFDTIQQAQEGKLKGGSLLFSLQNDGVGYAPGNLKLPDDVKTSVDKLSEQIKTGKVTVPETVAAT